MMTTPIAMPAIAPEEREWEDGAAVGVAVVVTVPSVKTGIASFNQ
jgi:hypothetical protein